MALFAFILDVFEDHSTLAEKQRLKFLEIESLKNFASTENQGKKKLWMAGDQKLED